MGHDLPAADTFARVLAQRDRAASAWRRLARDAGRADGRLAALLARLAASEQDHAARLARELPMIEGGEALSVDPCCGGRADGRRAGPSGACVGGEAADDARSGSDPLAASADGRLAEISRALESARCQELRLKTAFERLAASSPSDDVRLKALGLALAETRHLAAIDEALASVRSDGAM